VAMKKILSYRAMGSLCRQQAVFHPENSWKWLGEAERWEHLATLKSHPTSKNATPLVQVTEPNRVHQRTRRRLPPHEYSHASGSCTGTFDHLGSSVSCIGTYWTFCSKSICCAIQRDTFAQGIYRAVLRGTRLGGLFVFGFESRHFIDGGACESSRGVARI
jgi:hypothetical protein